jgi:CcmD family protein
MNGYLIFGYLTLWVFLFVYLMTLGLKFRSLERKVSQLENTMKREM